MLNLNNSLDVISESQTRNKFLRIDRGESCSHVTGSQENLNSIGTTDHMKNFGRKRSDNCVTQVHSASKPQNEFDATHVYDMNVLQ